MKSIKYTLLLLALACTATIAQAQDIVQIAGSNFRVELNEYEKTATIIDYEYVIDDHKYPIRADFRRLRRINGKVLIIPETVKVHGKEYTVTTIGRAAFAGYTNFNYLSIPETVTKIDEYAFFRTSIMELKIPASVISIGDRAFGRCAKLKHVTQSHDLTVGKDIYKDAHKDLRFHYNTDVAQRPKQEKKAQETVVTVSDIDTNIPSNAIGESATFAVIIANENYQHDATVDYALQDGRTVRTYCSQVLGLPAENIRYIEDASLNNMKAVISWLQKVVKLYQHEAKIIFYYAGHGVPDKEGATSLLPIDGNSADATTGYSLKNLYAALGSLQAKNVCVFLDACFSGKQRNDELLSEGVRGVRRAKEETPHGNMIVFSAAKSDETAHSYPAQGHGLFTYYLVKKLKETNGNVTLGELADYISKEVGRRAILVLNTEQTPTINTSAAMKNIWRDLNLK